jgi:WD40 repeat protein
VAFGSPGYAAPEQYGKAQTTPRADIYSLGAILHQMLSGDDPSLSPFRFAPLQRHDPALQQLIAQMLEMDESKRPASISEIQQTLKHIRNNPAPAVSGAPARPAGAPPVLASPAPRLVHEHHYGVVRAVAWSPDSACAASATDAIVRVWHASKGHNLCSYREHLGLIKHMVWSPLDTRIASVSEENKIRIWDSQSGKTIHIYPGDPHSASFNPNIVQWLAWSSGGRYLATGGSRATIIWDTDEGNPIVQLRNKYALGCRGLCWSPDGKSLAVAQGKTVAVYRLEEHGQVVHYRYNSPVNAVAWSPNGVYLATGGEDSLVHIWNVIDIRLLGIYRGHSRAVNTLAWAPDNMRIVSGAMAAGVHVWDILTGKDIVTYHAHVGHILAVAWSPDGRAILSGGSDCRVYVWNAP